MVGLLLLIVDMDDLGVHPHTSMHKLYRGTGHILSPDVANCLDNAKTRRVSILVPTISMYAIFTRAGRNMLPLGMKCGTSVISAGFS